MFIEIYREKLDLFELNEVGILRKIYEPLRRKNWQKAIELIKQDGYGITVNLKELIKLEMQGIITTAELKKILNYVNGN